MLIKGKHDCIERVLNEKSGSVYIEETGNVSSFACWYINTPSRMPSELSLSVSIIQMKSSKVKAATDYG